MFVLSHWQSICFVQAVHAKTAPEKLNIQLYLQNSAVFTGPVVLPVKASQACKIALYCSAASSCCLVTILTCPRSPAPCLEACLKTTCKLLLPEQLASSNHKSQYHTEAQPKEASVGHAFEKMKRARNARYTMLQSQQCSAVLSEAWSTIPEAGPATTLQTRGQGRASLASTLPPPLTHLVPNTSDPEWPAVSWVSSSQSGCGAQRVADLHRHTGSGAGLGCSARALGVHLSHTAA